MKKDLSDLVKTYTLQKCVDCKLYDQSHLEVKEDELFRVQVEPYLCPPCYVKGTTTYYLNLGVSTCQPTREEYE